METRKDFILRSIQKFSELLDGLFKKGKNKEEINIVINNFMIDEFDVSFGNFLKKSSEEITDVIKMKNYDLEDIKELSNILYMKFKIEEKLEMKNVIAEKAIEMYNYYGTKSKTYSLENNIKTKELLSFIENN